MGHLPLSAKMNPIMPRFPTSDTDDTHFLKVDGVIDQ